MGTFIDTSAFYALLDRNDAFHPTAKETWHLLLEQGEPLLTSNYILLESFALIQNRLGMRAVKVFHEDILPVLHLEWIDSAVHLHAVSSLLTADRRNLSLVDCTSFEVIRRLRVQNVFAFDAHFREQGFHVVNDEA